MHARDVLPAGTLLDGKYRIDRLIGAGGFGMTYAAHDLGLNQAVAVKEYYPAQFGAREGTLTVRPASEKDRDLFERLKDSFLREARTLAQLRHRCIVRVLSVFEGHGTAYMIMEFEAGKSLKAWIDGLGRPPTQDELDRITLPLLEALDVMHGASFLHRDIAPDNIIVRADGSPVLLDFGAARRVMAELSGALTGIVKQGYSPQEQYANDSRAQGPWSDIYALGATLYRCVTGKTPDEATLRMLDDPMRPAAEMAPKGYRPGFLAAIDKAMSVRPKDRPQSIAEMRRLLTQTAATAVAPSATLAAKATLRQEVAGAGDWTRICLPPKTRISEAYATSSRGWGLGIAALAVVALGGLGLAMVAYSSGRDEATRRQEQARREAEPTRGETRTAEAKKDLDARIEKARRDAEVARLKQAQAETETTAKARAEKAARDAAEQVKREAFARESAVKEEAAKTETQTSKPGAGGTLAKALEQAFGPCPDCGEVQKRIAVKDFDELKGVAAMIERTWTEVRERRGPNESGAARQILELLAKAALEPDPVAAIKPGAGKCTTYHFGFLDNSAERVGTHQCMLRMVRIGGNLTSLTLEKTTGDGFFADFKPFRGGAMAYLGRTFLKGHAVTRYNLVQPRNRENTNYGNKVGLLVSLGGRPALISLNQNGFTEPDPTFFEVMVLE